jgi:hypothetical protein
MDVRHMVNRTLRSIRTLIFFGAPLLVVACGALLDLEPLTFDEPLNRDAAPDTTADTSSSDAPTDAGIDTATHCTDGKRHDFCDDFEGITGEIQDRWNKRKEVTGTGKIGAVAADAAPSPVTVFSSMIDRGPDGGMEVHIARLSKQESPWRRTDGGAQPGVRLVFEAMIVALDDTYEVSVADLITGTSMLGEDAILLVAKREGTEAVFRISEIYGADGGSVPVFTGKAIATRVPLGQWTHYEIEIQERASGAGGANFTVGTASTSYTLESTSRVPYFRGDVGVAIGSYVGSRTHVLYDNVRIDYQP